MGLVIETPTVPSSVIGGNMAESYSSEASSVLTLAKSFPSKEEVESSKITSGEESGETHNMSLITSSGPSMSAQSWLDLVSGRESFRMRYLIDSTDGPGFKGGLKWWTSAQKSRLAWAKCWLGESPGGVNLDLTIVFYSDPPRMSFRFKAGSANEIEPTPTKLATVDIGKSYKEMSQSSFDTCYTTIIEELQSLKAEGVQPLVAIDLSWMTEATMIWYKTLIKNIVVAALQGMEWREQARAAKIVPAKADTESEGEERRADLGSLNSRKDR